MSTSFKQNFKFKKLIQLIYDYFRPKFVDINGQKVTKKFPWLFYLTFAISLIAIILLFIKIKPDFQNSQSFLKLIANFFKFNTNAVIGSRTDITIADTTTQSLKLLWQTISYSILGTIIGIFLGIPIALLSSKNFIKTPWIYVPMRAFMSIMRTIPPIVYAYIIYFILSPSLVATLSIAIFVASLMAKWLYEDLDTYDVSSYYGLQAIGNTKWIAFKKSILPYLLKRIVSYGFYSFEMVVRFAAILSIIGISTIGQLMADEYAVPNNFAHLSIAIWILVAFMILLEIFTFLVKKWILEYSPKHPTIDENLNFKKKLEQLKKQKPKNIYIKITISIIIFILFIISLFSIEFRTTGPEGLAYFNEGVKNLFTPNLSVFKWDSGDNPIILGTEALAIAILASVIGLVFSLFFGILASKKISGKFVSLFFKFIIITLRAIPPFTYALIFLLWQKDSIIWAGTLALAIHSIGMLAKLINESVDKIDDKVFQSLESLGLSTWTKIKIGVIKEILPQTLSNFLYRIEINFKSTVIIGAVGACDYGYQITVYSADIRYWSILSSYLIFTIVLLLIIEQISNMLRKKIMNGYFLEENAYFKKYFRNNVLVKALALSKINKEIFVYDNRIAKYNIAKFNNQLKNKFYFENKIKLGEYIDLKRRLLNQSSLISKELRTLKKEAFLSVWNENKNLRIWAWSKRLKLSLQSSDKVSSKYFENKSIESKKHAS
ncbi:ABC transporter permease subunit [Mycoplasma sp. CSL7491-lung]|uniref:PhnE/PtxC family ABC transporter permease n=1 Tax=Mycoplasma sp. CSL7491-lung TaxID=549718 RepID=UPI001C0FADFC|nr:ABC transporter permease subunit [Mycoplasma sp. CSL7491-lung]MBU4693211.1 ABC transporter permease subunit [Mycoplasma sp. CSL7491-lung]